MENDIKQVLAKNLGILMKDKGWIKADLARETMRFEEVNQRTIGSYLKDGGVDANPTLNKVASIAACFNLSVSELLDENLGTRQNINATLLKSSMVTGVELLSESRVITEASAQVILDSLNDLTDATLIVLNDKLGKSQSATLDFLTFLNKRNQ